MTKAREVAGKLTKAQRAALLAEHGSVGVCRALKRKGLADRIEGTGMSWSSFPCLTRLGLEVRTLIQENPNAD